MDTSLMGTQDRYDDKPDSWASGSVAVGSDIYLLTDPDNPEEVTTFHWCQNTKQWRVQKIRNHVLLHDPVTLESVVEFYCCVKRGRVSSGNFNSY